jgi:hypothetical protein
VGEGGSGGGRAGEWGLEERCWDGDGGAALTQWSRRSSKGVGSCVK